MNSISVRISGSMFVDLVKQYSDYFESATNRFTINGDAVSIVLEETYISLHPRKLNEVINCFIQLIYDCDWFGDVPVEEALFSEIKNNGKAIADSISNVEWELSEDNMDEADFDGTVAIDITRCVFDRAAGDKDIRISHTRELLEF